MRPPKGKYVTIDINNPDALGICDYSGSVFNKRDLVKQMEWRGNALEWTGFLVGKPFIDVPNEQNRNPVLPPDPVPVPLPRVMQDQTITWEQNLQLPWEQLIMYPWENWGTIYNGAAELNEAQKLSQLENVNWMGG
jgi:hypothetical protein